MLKYGYFHLDSSRPDPIKLQKGIVRTNCMDNLDRTNVGQAAIAKWTLNRQLKALGILQESDNVENYEDVDVVIVGGGPAGLALASALGAFVSSCPTQAIDFASTTRIISYHSE